MGFWVLVTYIKLNEYAILDDDIASKWYVTYQKHSK